LATTKRFSGEAAIGAGIRTQEPIASVLDRDIPYQIFFITVANHYKQLFDFEIKLEL
jgi:hypothetical protein